MLTPQINGSNLDIADVALINPQDHTKGGPGSIGITFEVQYQYDKVDVTFLPPYDSEGIDENVRKHADDEIVRFTVRVDCYSGYADLEGNVTYAKAPYYSSQDYIDLRFGVLKEETYDADALIARCKPMAEKHYGIAQVEQYRPLRLMCDMAGQRFVFETLSNTIGVLTFDGDKTFEEHNLDEDALVRMQLGRIPLVVRNWKPTYFMCWLASLSQCLVVQTRDDRYGGILKDLRDGYDLDNDCENTDLPFATYLPFDTEYTLLHNKFVYGDEEEREYGLAEEEYEVR